ncbi:hypothetical protein [Paraglaciecola sp.]|uniref:hypothetical protein n=1 Tax=Paraglaciecola sp. TaxID=1920173 RepID=UPI0030F46FE1
MDENKLLMEDVENIDLEQLFTDSDINSISQTFSDYLLSLNAFYTELTSDSSPFLIQHFDKFNPEELSEKDSAMVTKSLIAANYDESSLRGEHIVLFPDPVIVSEIRCTDIPKGETTGALRLISHNGFDKKIIIKRETVAGYNPEVTLYKIHEIVWGIILPVRCKFKSVKITNYRALHCEYERLENTQKALVRAIEAPKIEMQSLRKKFQYIDSIIEIKRNQFSTIKGDISVLELEKKNAAFSLDNTLASVKKVRTELDLTSNEYENLVGNIKSKSEQLGHINEQTNSQKDTLKNEKVRLSELQAQTKQMAESLDSIKVELADASRKKNLTTLDMVGHSNETARQLRPYYFLAVLVFTGLAWMAGYIYINGESFAAIVPFLVGVSSWDILISRLPLITATTLIIGGLSGAFFYLIKHIVSLNTEKMTMLKAAILAEQITNSLDCKTMTEQEQLEFKRDTKIKLITQVFSKNETTLEISTLIIDALKAANPK